MALEALADPLSRLRFLPLAMNFATATEVGVNDPYYATTHQYVKNDVCLSGDDDGAYIFLGGATDKTTTFAGPDPSADANWVSLKPSGANSSAAVVPVVTGAGSPPYAVASGTLSGLPEGSKWLVNWQCTATKATATDADDAIKWTLTGAGAGGSSASMTQLPVVDAVTPVLANDFSGSVVITVGAAGTIALTGTTLTALTNSSTLAITGSILSATMVSLQ
jgi:hypothetical protein